MTTSAGNQSSPQKKFRNIGKEVIDRYKHEQLPSEDMTRLLILWPKTECKDGHIHATLQELKFTDLLQIKFEALSYHWGSVEDQRIIRLHNHGHKYEALDEMTRVLSRGKFRIRRNLYHALQTFQSEDKPKLLWIDVLCINQDDSDEKERQLAQINLVYEKAHTVLIWLGPSTDRRLKAMEFVKKVVNLSDVRRLATDKSEIDNWGCLAELMQVTWFTRRWVIQELALARRAVVYCGESRVDWDDLRDAISLMGRYMDEISALLKDSKKYDNNYYALGDIDTLEAKILVDTVHNVFRRNRVGTPFEPIQGLEYLVSTLSNFHSADPRDTINALRNIAKESTGSKALKGDNVPPKPDYSPDKTLTDIYIDFVQWVYQTTGRIDIICRKWALPEQKSRPTFMYSDNYPVLSELPSWIQPVPHRNQPEDTGFGTAGSVWRTEGDSFVGAPGERPYNACFSVPAEVMFPKRSGREQSQDGQCLPGEDESSSKVWASEASQSRGHQQRTPPVDHERRKRQSLEDRRTAVIRSIFTNFDIADLDGIEGAIELSDTPAMTPSATDKRTSSAIDASIRVTGVQIGKICMTTDSMSKEIVHEKVVASLRGGKNNECPDKLWRGLVAERGAVGRNPPATYHRACRLIVNKHADRGHIDTRELLTRGHGLSDVEKEYLKRVQAVICNRVFFEASQTSPSYPESELLQGFGPGDAEKDDVVCILFGCSVPVILRRVNDQDHFRLMGECYVYGLMDGDAISSLGDGLESRKRQFRII